MKRDTRTIKHFDYSDANEDVTEEVYTKVNNGRLGWVKKYVGEGICPKLGVSTTCDKCAQGPLDECTCEYERFSIEDISDIVDEISVLENHVVEEYSYRTEL